MTEAVSRHAPAFGATRCAPRREAGVAMMESLIAMVVLLVGLLGIVGLQAKTQTSHFEAYQRAQALLLLDDMVARLLPTAMQRRVTWSPRERPARRISERLAPDTAETPTALLLPALFRLAA